MGRERVGEGVDLLRLDREAGGRTVPAEALEVLAHAASAPWRSKLGMERPDPFQASSVPRDQNDRPVEALDEA